MTGILTLIRFDLGQNWDVYKTNKLKLSSDWDLKWDWEWGLGWVPPVPGVDCIISEATHHIAACTSPHRHLHVSPHNV